MKSQTHLLRFDAFNLSIQIISLLAPVAEAIQRHDRGLDKQMREAASSVSLNLAESRGRKAGNRMQSLRVAHGSAEETAACLYVAHAWGYVTEAQIEPALARLDHLLAVLTKLTR